MLQRRNTPQRELVRSVMQDNFTHPTAEEVYDVLRREHPKLSFATVYRNMNLLAEQGELVRLHMPVGPDHYDITTTPHYHFLCRRCHKLLDVDLPFSDEVEKIAPHGCKTESHLLTLIGLCPDCQS